jgi:hypothetical protein
MKINLTGMAKSLALAVAIVAIMTLGQGVVRADVVNFQGSTAGCFNCGPGGPFANTSILGAGLTYNSSTFNVTTNQLGNASIGNTASPPANFNNLGSFTLSSTPGSYNGTFTLQVNFAAPLGAGSPTFTATVEGLVEQTSQGNLMIDFNNDWQTFSFANGGSFQFRVNDVSITPGGTIALSGDIRAATNVPEPATLLLLGTGLAGVAGAARRKMKRGRSSEETL